MTRTLIAAALSFGLLGSAQANNSLSLDNSCGVSSNYDVSVDEERIVLSDGVDTITFADGELLRNGVAVSLTRKQQHLLRQYEKHGRDVLEEARAIAMEGVDIATYAVGEALSTLSNDKERAREISAKLAATGKELKARILETKNSEAWEDEAFGNEIEAMVEELIPEFTAEITRLAMSAAISGNEAALKEIERKAEAMESRLEAEVEARAGALEERAEAMCDMLAEMDELEEDMAIELADNRRFDAIQR